MRVALVICMVTVHKHECIGTVRSEVTACDWLYATPPFLLAELLATSDHQGSLDDVSQVVLSHVVVSHVVVSHVVV